MKNQQQLIEEYLYYGKQQRKLNEKTIRAYAIDLKQFSVFVEGEKLDFLPREMLIYGQQFCMG